MDSLSGTSTFAHILLNWYASNQRVLPWREGNNPYNVWLSEIILQQTRVEQGLPYYHALKNRFPTIQSLASAPLDSLLKLWQGLGYYSRARNMHFAANQIVTEHNGQFPNSYAQLLKLKGVGEYTAAAIASIAFGEPVAVVDGNVFRVLSRLFGVETPIQSTAGKKQFNVLANQLMDRNNPSDYNQAIMEFGALFCVPSNPDCVNCPFSHKCLAFANGKVQQLPVKKASKPKLERFLLYLFISDGSHTWICQRTGKDIWQNLWEFPTIETETPILLDHLLKEALLENHVSGKIRIGSPVYFKHILSHRVLHATFLPIHLTNESIVKLNAIKIRLEEVSTYPTHRLMERFMEKNSASKSSNLFQY